MHVFYVFGKRKVQQEKSITARSRQQLSKTKKGIRRFYYSVHYFRKKVSLILYP